MAQPPVPVLPYSFQSSLGTTFGTELDANFADLVTSTTAIIANLALIQRDDGFLRNQSVGADSFTSDALTLMAGSSVSPDGTDWRPIGIWATATLYRVGNIVESGSPAVAYACSVQHVSAGSFATDYAAHKWVVLSAPRSLISADVTGALGYTPVDVAGDVMTGALTLITGSKFGATNPMTLTDTLLTSQDLVTIDKGLYSAYNSSASDIVYGFAANVVRDAGSFLTVGMQCSGIVTSGLTEAAFGGNLNAVGLSGYASSLVGLEIDVASYTPGNSAEKWGMNLIFFDRAGNGSNPGQYSYPFPFGTYTSVGSGLGANLYNKNAKAVVIESQPRSSAGEYCGWSRGIYFKEFALDSETNSSAPGSRAYPIGIDFSDMHYYGGTDPVVAFNMEAALALRDFQAVWWNRDPSNPFSGSKVKSYMNPAVGRWIIDNGGTERFGVDVATGTIYSNGVAIGAGVSLSGNNTWTGTNAFNGPVHINNFIDFNNVDIVADFSNADIALRTTFKTNVSNSATEVGAIPNGSSTLAALYAATSTTVGQAVRLSVDAASAQLAAGRFGGAAFVPFDIGNGGVTSMRLQTDGRLSVGTSTAPSTGSNQRFSGPVQIDNQVSFSVTRGGSSFNVANATVQLITFTSVVFDTGSAYSTGTGRFTPPAGKYLLTGAVATGAGAPDATVLVSLLYKNGSQHKSGNFTNCAFTGNACGSTFTCIVEANGTDFFDMRVSQANGLLSTVAMTGQTTDTYFQGYKIS